jgi:hypothetical protein
MPRFYYGQLDYIDQLNAMDNTFVAGGLGIASATILGGIKVGSGLVIDATGILSSSGSTVNTVAGRSPTSGNVALVKGDISLGNVDNTSDVSKPVSTAQSNALALKEIASNKDATGGYAGLTAYKLNLRNAANTITSFFQNSNTVARNYTLPDKDGVIATIADITGYSVPIATASTLGGVKVGTGLAVDGSGVLSATGSSAQALLAFNLLLIGA